MSDNIKSIPLEVMNNKIERLCRSKVNFNVKREQFHKLEQGEDETINDFEVMVRAKVQNCEFGKGANQRSANASASTAPPTMRRTRSRFSSCVK